jgi:hypothetical protein
MESGIMSCMNYVNVNITGLVLNGTYFQFMDIPLCYVIFVLNTFFLYKSQSLALLCMFMYTVHPQCDL